MGNDVSAYLLCKRGLYYRPNSQGYTGIKDSAGRYTLEEATSHADAASGATFIAEAEAPDYSEACFHDIALDHLRSKHAEALARLAELEARMNAPELHDFAAGVALEAAHQRQRWGADHDAGKEPEDWFWLLGWLGGKAVKAAREGDRDKALHHTISTAAALANWHAALLGADTAMRPGIDPEARGYSAAS